MCFLREKALTLMVHILRWCIFRLIRVYIIRYEHDNIDENNNDINDENKQLIRDTSIARTLI